MTEREDGTVAYAPQNPPPENTAINILRAQLETVNSDIECMEVDIKNLMVCLQDQQDSLAELRTEKEDLKSAIHTLQTQQNIRDYVTKETP